MKKEIFLYKLLKENAYFFSVYSCGLTYSFVASANSYGKIDGLKYILVKSDKWEGELKVLPKSVHNRYPPYWSQKLFPDLDSISRANNPYIDTYIPLKIKLWILLGFLLIDWKYLREESKIDEQIKKENIALKERCLKNKLEIKKFFGEM